MTVRRRFLIAIGFLTAAAMLASTGSARAQKSGPPSPGSHEPLTGGVTPDQVKAALERFSKGGMPNLPPEMLDFFKDKMEREGNKKLDEKQMNEAMEMLKANPQLRQQLEEMSKKFRNNGGKNGATEEQRKEFEKFAQQFEKMMPKNGGQPPFVNPMPAMPPMPGMVDPPMPPPKNIPNGIDPKMPPPMPPEQIPIPKNELAQKNPFDMNETPRDKAAQVAASLWERNIGPLDDTPEVKRALFDLVEGTDDIRDANGKSFWEDLSLETGDSTSFSDLLDGASMGESWSFPKFELPSFGFNSPDSGPDVGGSSPPRENWWSRLTGGDRKPSSSTSSPRTPSGPGFNFGIPALEGTWWPVVILGGLLFGALLAWKLWGLQRARARAALGFGGPGWPIDPRRITTREHVVLAFEYLSVMICGPRAKTWTHNTIAEALTDLAQTHGEAAIMLARLYELARYAPLDEPLTTAELAEARRLVCSLAGLDYE